MRILTHNLGFPRIGPARELKHALEAFWAGKSDETTLLALAKTLRRQNWELQKAMGIDLIPSNDFSLYDHVLDTCALVGAVPQRFGWTGGEVDLGTYFAMGRGAAAVARSDGEVATALEMTKWFDTNYHYLVPELHPGQKFQLASTKPLDEFREAKALDIDTVPVLLGPLSFLLLGKTRDEQAREFNPLVLLEGLLPVYESLLRQLAGLGARWIQLDEPVLATDLSEATLALFQPAYCQLRAAAGATRLMLATYFGDLGTNLPVACHLPVDAIHIDAVRASQEVEMVLETLPTRMALSLGVVDGRNIWRNDFANSLRLLEHARQILGPARLMVSPSCSLLHVPVSLKSDSRLDAELKGWLAFAEQKLEEVATLGRLLELEADASRLAENEATIRSRRLSGRVHDVNVKIRCDQANGHAAQRGSPYDVRAKIQAAELPLPPLPTTTIGSFPQTTTVRNARARFKRGEWSLAQYEQFLEQEIRSCIRQQEDLGLDVLVHGEFERNDMVEYFGEQLSGFAFTQNGWVQSYGSRCVKPPILFGDVSRPKPMTVRWTTFAQSLTPKPVKGMLTGPLTILQWSFVRDDQPRSQTARQLALAIRDEVLEHEAAGTRIIQIDEPALREGLPLRRANRAVYLNWAADAFRLATAGIKDSTQIHTHMCYSEFNDILEGIAALDVDVISFETSRSNMDLLRAFTDFRYPAAVGPGVWDIHSPRVPTTSEMVQRLQAAVRVTRQDRLWVNPDCGLKTRSWEEVVPALRNLVVAAKALRHSGSIAIDTHQEREPDRYRLPLIRMTPTSICEHYAEDHRQLDALFHQFQGAKTTDPSGARKAFQDFKAGLEQHIVWEEQILFPSFDRRFGHLQGGPTGVMRWEHQQIRQYLNAIALKLSREDFATEEEEMGLEAVLCPHNEKEETIVYPMVDQMVGVDERAQIFAAMDKMP